MIKNIGGKIGAETFWSVCNGALSQLLTLLVFFITARYVDKEAFGIIATCYLVIEAFRQIVTESISSTMLSKPELTDRDYNAAFILHLLISIFMAGVIFIVAPFIADFFGQESIRDVMRALCLVILTAGLSKTHELWLSRHFDFRSLAIRSIVSIMLGGAAGIALAVTNHGVMSIVAQHLLTAVTSTLFLWGVTGWKPKFAFSVADITGIARKSSHIGLAALTGYTNSQGDIFFSSYYLGPAAVGVYNAAKRMIIAANGIVSSGLNSIAFPLLSDSARDPEKIRKSFITVLFFTSCLTAPAFAGLMCLSDDIIIVLLGNSWAETAPVLTILAVPAYVSSIGFYNTNILFIYNRVHWQTGFTIIYSVTSIVLFVIFAPQGLLPLAMAFLARGVALHPLSTYAALRLLQLRAMDYLNAIFPPLLCACIMGLLTFVLKERYFTDQAHWVALVALTLFGIVTYSGLMFALFKPRLQGALAQIRDHSQDIKVKRPHGAAEAD